VRKVASGGQDREQQGVCGLKTKTLQGIELSGWIG